MAARVVSIYINFDPPSELKLIFVPPYYLVDYFEYLVCPFKSDRLSSIRLCYTSDTDKFDSGETFFLRKAFDFAYYISMIDAERNGWLLELIRNDLREICLEYGGDAEAIDAAAREIARKGYHFRGEWGKGKYSPSRKYKASIWIEYDDRPKIFLRIQPRNEIIMQRLLSVGNAGFESIRQACKKITWEANDIVRIWNDNLRDYWEYCIHQDKLEYLFMGGSFDMSIGHHEFILGKMYLDGYIVLSDNLKGMSLIELSAKKGYKHAKAFLENIDKSST